MPSSSRARLARIVAAGALVACLAAPAAAHPCVDCAPGDSIHWRNDRPLQPGETGDSQPSIDVDGDAFTSRAAIAWTRDVAGATSLHVAVTADGGCAWDARAVTTGPADAAPDVAVSVAADAVAVAYLDAGVVKVVVSFDGGRSFSAPETLDRAAPADATSRPRIGMISSGGILHLHVAWCEGRRLRVANSAGGLAGSWVTGPPLSDLLIGWSSWTDVDVAADTRSRDPSTDSGVTLLAAGLAPATTTPEIWALRSNDSGTTFFGDPSIRSSENVPRLVSDVRPPDDPALGASAPELDVSDDGSGEFYTWEVASYTDPAVPGSGCKVDGRAEEGSMPSTIADWNDTADASRLAFSAAGLAVIPNPGSRPPEPVAHVFMRREMPPVATEIFSWRANVASGYPERLQQSCPPYRLTGETPPRASGAVVQGSFVADEDLSEVWAAWTDTRDGGTSVWWKRTDAFVDAPAAPAIVPGDCATGGGVLVSWNLPPSPPNCDVEQFVVELGDAPSTYTISQVATGGSAQIVGLQPGRPYYGRVTVWDEACNFATAAEVSGLSADCSGGGTRCPLPVGGSLRVVKTPTPDDAGLSWSPPPVDGTHDAADSFDVYRSTTRPQDGFALLASVAPTALDDPGACLPAAAPRHFYLVVARNACGTSGDEPLP